MISKNIQFLRRKMGLTQEALAEKVGTTRQTVAKWENGDSAPDIEMADRLCLTLDVSLDELVREPLAEPPKNDLQNGKHIFGLVTVGEKGQIVIPVQARRVFGISPGDQLMVLGDEGYGLALVNAGLFMDAAEAIKNGRK
jgi:AbrB family looped-hinge helix DNA binding protein